MRIRDGFQAGILGAALLAAAACDGQGPGTAGGAGPLTIGVSFEILQTEFWVAAMDAFQAHPDIGLVFTSSDFLLPSIVSALKSAGKYFKADEPGHMLPGGFDGDATAYQMLGDGYLDATGVQDVFFEVQTCIQAILDWRAGKRPPETIRDPGFVIHRANLKEKAPQMWGARARKP